MPQKTVSRAVGWLTFILLLASTEIGSTFVVVDATARTTSDEQRLAATSKHNVMTDPGTALGRVSSSAMFTGRSANTSSSRAATVLDESTGALLTCTYSLTFRSEAGRYFAVAPDDPYTDDLREAVSADLQYILTGQDDGTVAAPSHNLSAERRSVLSAFLRQNGTCSSGVSRARDNTTAFTSTANTRSDSMTTLLAAVVSVVEVEKQVFGRLPWVGAEVRVVFTLSPDSSGSGGDNDGSSSSTGAASYTDVAYVDFLNVLNQNREDGTRAPFTHLSDDVFRDQLTRRSRNSRVEDCFLYPDLTLSDLVAAADATNSTTTAYPAALTQHLSDVYGKGSEDARCEGVSCVFAIICILLAIALIVGAMIAFVVRLCQRRRQDSVDNKRLLRLEGQHRKAPVSGDGAGSAPAR